MDVYSNLNQELKSSMQSAINSLGPNFWNCQSFHEKQFGSTIHWSQFGEGATFYHVSVYDKDMNGMNVCTGSVVIAAAELDFAPTRKDDGDPFDFPQSGLAAALFPGDKANKKALKIALLNTAILTGGGGTYRLAPIALDEAKALINEGIQQDNGACITSYIGHESTATIMGALLGTPVAFSRNQFKQDGETIALCFKLNGRPAEGQILTASEIEKIGYEWYELVKLS